jgi:hypothetical protein
VDASAKIRLICGYHHDWCNLAQNLSIPGYLEQFSDSCAVLTGKQSGVFLMKKVT